MTNITQPNCPFCRDNNILKGDVIAESDTAYLIRPDGGTTAQYLIIPNQHVETLADLPDDWWKSFKAMLQNIPDLGESYNLSLNYGKPAGQSVKHLHFWIILRPENHPASGKGLAKLIDEAVQE